MVVALAERKLSKCSFSVAVLIMNDRQMRYAVVGVAGTQPQINLAIQEDLNALDYVALLVSYYCCCSAAVVAYKE